MNIHAVFFNNKKRTMKKPIFNDPDEWFINNLVALSTSELALVRSGKIDKVDRKKILNWYIDNM